VTNRSIHQTEYYAHFWKLVYPPERMVTLKLPVLSPSVNPPCMVSPSMRPSKFNIASAFSNSTVSVILSPTMTPLTVVFPAPWKWTEPFASTENANAVG
jgi:hypothetical protein